VAFETCCVVGICLVWLVEESGVRQLEFRQSIILGLMHIVPPKLCAPQLAKVAGAAM
jgi:hypothetical protein